MLVHLPDACLIVGCLSTRGSEGHILLNNRGIARQIETLARRGNLCNVLVIKTRADEAARKNYSAALDREHEQFRKLCLDELRVLAASSQGEGVLSAFSWKPLLLKQLVWIHAFLPKPFRNGPQVIPK